MIKQKAFLIVILLTELRIINYQAKFLMVVMKFIIRLLVPQIYQQQELT